MGDVLDFTVSFYLHLRNLYSIHPLSLPRLHRAAVTLTPRTPSRRRHGLAALRRRHLQHPRASSGFIARPGSISEGSSRSRPRPVRAPPSTSRAPTPPSSTVPAFAPGIFGAVRIFSSNPGRASYFKMFDKNIEFQLKSDIGHVLSKLNSELHRMIHVELGTGCQDIETESSSKHVLSKLHSELYQMTPRIKTYHRRKRQKCDNLDEFYKEHVILKIGKADKKKVVVHLGGVYIHENIFVECFKPRGWMSNFVVCCLTNLWNEEWVGKTILSQLAVDELLGRKLGQKNLAGQLNKEVLGRTKLIFIPINSSGTHWNLAALDLSNRNKRVFDSLENEASLDTANRALSSIEEYLDQFAISGFTLLNQKVRQQGNCDDCGFYMMLFIKEMSTLDLPVEFDDGTILKFRKELVWLLLKNPENKPYIECPTPDLRLGCDEFCM